jgi:RNA polymerase sigma-70 factor (ECF subfamily)
MDTVDFHAVYRAHAADVRRFAQWLCRDRHDAEDLAAEAFVRAFAGSDAIDARTVRGYLLAIVRNLHLEQLRRRRPTEPLDADAAAPDAGPCAHAESAQTARRLAAALVTLEETERSALWLRADAGLAYEEIAALLGISVANAKVKVHRARSRLAQRLEEPL